MEMDKDVDTDKDTEIVMETQIQYLNVGYRILVKGLSNIRHIVGVCSLRYKIYGSDSRLSDFVHHGRCAYLGIQSHSAF
jgi:hypothetical protein